MNDEWEIYVMKPEIKAMNDLLDALSGLAARDWTAQEISKALGRALPAIPRPAIEILIGLTEEKFRSNPSRGPLVIATFAGVLLRQYDGTPLTLSEWRELRDLVSDCADELDMDTVTYAMSLIMDYGAL
jgi:hypothetical protein